MAQVNSNSEFVVRFVASNNGGVKADGRVEKRIAFPDRKSVQPQINETWKVKIAGENPTKTVYFLTCIEKVDDSALPAATPAPAAPKSDNRGPRQNKRNDRKHGSRDDKRGGRKDSGPSHVLFASTEPSNPTSAAVSDFIYAPGADAYEQAKAWLAPIEKIDLANLRFAHAQKSASADQQAREMAAAMVIDLRLVDEAGAAVDALRAQVKAGGKDGEAAEEVFKARKRSEAATEAKRQLQLDTLSYGRLKQSYKKDGKADDAEANAHLAVIKGDLDSRRLVVNEEVEAAKKALDDADLARLFSYDSEAVDSIVVTLYAIEKHEATRAQNLEGLKVQVRSYEERIDQLRRSA